MEILFKISLAVFTASWAIIQFWFIGPLSANLKVSLFNFGLYASDAIIMLGLLKWFAKE